MRILLCSYFKFPNKCAGAIRHEKFAQMLQDLGHDVLIAATGESTDFQINAYKDIKYISLRYNTPGIKHKIKMRLLYWSNLKKVISSFGPTCIIMDDLRPTVIKKLKSFCKQRNIRLVHDSVEWYSKEQFKLGPLSPAFIDKEIVNRLSIDASCRVIAISRFLKKHFEAKNIDCVNIPIVVSDEDLHQNKNLQQTINITYAGQAGKKDYLHIIVSAMAQLSKEEKTKFKLHVLGCSEEQMIKNGISKKLLDTLGSSIKIYGRVPRDTVFKVLKESDFTVLIRSETQRYAKAGFPTKVVESLSHSTPVIANITSDLGQYLVDGYNSLIVPNATAEALKTVLQKAISLSYDQRREMCINAYHTALNRFHYKNFLDELNKIIN